MKLFFIDDTNIAKEEHLGFFIYGGLIIDKNVIRDSVNSFMEIKKKHNIAPNLEIKWNNVNDLDPTELKTLKHEMLKLVKRYDCRIIVYLAPQDFYHESELKKRKGKSIIKYIIEPKKYLTALKYATNVCLQKFNHYLNDIGEKGLVFADETGLCKKEIQEYYFSIYPKGTDLNSLNQIAYMVVPVNSLYSQMHHINDVTIGAIQHSLKEYEKNFLPDLKDSFWSKKIQNKTVINEYGFNVYPKKAKTVKIQKMLERVGEKFKRRINY